jgi:hypothetical protein
MDDSEIWTKENSIFLNKESEEIYRRNVFFWEGIAGVSD